ncbi:multicopper oxidase family protein [Chitinilyticum piscinae]|uniref:Copper oxidase n=1 Tax=Chitinilyticum piscinae TaxID=2866724 RepID=A0A8J7FHE5_9NEIS|nr:copper oxidase [Chitinilyticum piscinae]MBE9608250.1 copper oxidase [Chitinilyticum piscinae]
MQRRDFLGASAGALAGLGLLGIGREASAAAASVANPLGVSGGRTPVTTLNTRTLGFRMNNGVKEYHLIAEPVEQEVAPGMTALFWGYNGSSPGPTIEAVEGDRVRIFVTNKLPEHTTIHWHGILLPAGMDGVGGLTQPQIKPGETYVYEFTLGKSGTFMYHPHADEMVQMAQGMMGMFIVHPKNPAERRVDRDYAFMLASYKIDPGTRRPDPSEMLDFNLWTFNSRTFPAIAPLVARTGERVRIRVANLTMTNHPVHVHGVDFRVTGTDGGWVPEAGQWPEVTTDVAVGQIRVIEFVAKAPGDWALHCHKSHHTMGPMGHGVPNMLGVDQAAATAKIEALLPGQHYMEMGSNGMAEMQDMAAMAAMMPLPPNTLPMMTGEGPFGPIEMGGMFTLLKVRDAQKPGDYSDPGWYEHPPGTVARPADSKAFSGIPT